jgi:hypothetical protein
VGFYPDEGALLEHYAPFAESVLNAGQVLIMLGIDSRRSSLERKLEARGTDVDRLARDGRYRWWDVAEAIEKFVVKDWPDETRFWNVVPPLIREAAAASKAEHPRVAVWGRMRPTLWRQGKVEAAIRLEQLWDEFVRAYGVDTLCAYSSSESLRDQGSSAPENLRGTYLRSFTTVRNPLRWHSHVRLADPVTKPDIHREHHRRDRQNPDRPVER